MNKQWQFSQYYSFDAIGMPMRFDISFKSLKLTVIDFFWQPWKNLQYMLEKMKCWAMFIKIVPFNPDRGQHSTIESQHGFKISATSFLSPKQTSLTSESYRKLPGLILNRNLRKRSTNYILRSLVFIRITKALLTPCK